MPFFVGIGVPGRYGTPMLHGKSILGSNRYRWPVAGGPGGPGDPIFAWICLDHVFLFFGWVAHKDAPHPHPTSSATHSRSGPGSFLSRVLQSLHCQLCYRHVTFGCPWSWEEVSKTSILREQNAEMVATPPHAGPQPTCAGVIGSRWLFVLVCFWFAYSQHETWF